MTTKADPDTLPDELTITLRKPITFPPGPNGERYDHLTLREPTVGHLMQVAAYSGVEESVRLIFHVSGMPIGAVQMMGVRDLKKAERFLTGFFDQETAGEAG